MNKKKLAIIILMVLVGLGLGATLFAYHKGTEPAHTPYVTLTPNTDERVDSALKGDFRLYRFPVVTDGRPYTIVVEPISGRPELYASRYEPDVDELIDILSWWCDDDHCGQSGSYDGFQTFTFYAPVGDGPYYSWFSVYGDTATQYKVRVVNQTTVVRTSVSVSSNNGSSNNVNNNGSAGGSTVSVATVPSPGWINWIRSSEIDDGGMPAPDGQGNMWYSQGYSQSGWQSLELPDDIWTCVGCSRYYRGTFRVDSLNKSLFADFLTDDGLELYVNGTKVGAWGGLSGNQLGCLNMCLGGKTISPIDIRSYLHAGDNLITARVYNAYAGGYFKLDVTQ